MPDFFDQLWEQLHNPRSQIQRHRYLEQLKTLIPLSPSPRLLAHDARSVLQTGHILHACPTELPRVDGPAPDLFLFDLSDGLADPSWFRQAKNAVPMLPFWRLDVIVDELKVIETRAMGADAYCLDMGGLDVASAQYLAEVGRDYDIPAVLVCSREEDLARAFQIKDVQHYWLRDILVAPQLLELAWLSGKHVIFDVHSQDQTAAFAGDWPAKICLVHRETGTVIERLPREDI